MYFYISAHHHQIDGWMTKIGVSARPEVRRRSLGLHYGYAGCRFTNFFVYNCRTRKQAFGMEGMVIAALFRQYPVKGEELVYCCPEVAMDIASSLIQWLEAQP